MGLLSKLKRSLSRRQLKHPPRIEPVVQEETSTQPAVQPAAAAPALAVAAEAPRPQPPTQPSASPLRLATTHVPTPSSPVRAAAAAAARPSRARAPSVATAVAVAAAEAEDAEDDDFHARATTVFGPDTATRLGSAKWSERNFAVAHVHENLRGIGGGAGAGADPSTSYTMEDMFNLVVDTVARCTEDKVAPVFFSAVDLFGDLLDAFGSAVDAIKVRAVPHRAAVARC